MDLSWTKLTQGAAFAQASAAQVGCQQQGKRKLVDTSWTRPCERVTNQRLHNVSQVSCNNSWTVVAAPQRAAAPSSHKRSCWTQVTVSEASGRQADENFWPPPRESQVSQLLTPLLWTHPGTTDKHPRAFNLHECNIQLARKNDGQSADLSKFATNGMSLQRLKQVMQQGCRKGRCQQQCNKRVSVHDLVQLCRKFWSMGKEEQ